MTEGSDVTIVATGHLVWKALEAAKELLKVGIHAEVINIHTIKPLDTALLLSSIGKTGCVVTAEEHQRNGGLGDSVAQLLSQKLPVPMEYVAVNDQFGQSGTPSELMDVYGLNTSGIVDAAKKVILRK